jgi:hypothetical protein
MKYQASKSRERPMRTKYPSRTAISTILVGFMFAIFIIMLAGCRNSENANDSKGNAISDNLCRTDLRCWAGKNINSAILCREPIEKLTRFDFKWDDKFLEGKFSHFRWHNKAAGTVTYLGDKLLLQNKFGAYERMIYECDYDPIGETPLAVRMNPGRLK